MNCSRRIGTACALAFVILITLIVAPAMAGASLSGYPLYAWGQGSADPADTPTRVGDNYWIASATASGGFYAICENGYLHAWGAAGNANQMGQGPSGTDTILTEPAQIGTANNWTMVSAMANNVAAINANGELFRWGSASNPFSAQDTPMQVGTAANWTYVSAGGSGAGSNVFAINDDGELWAMGHNANGQLGSDNTTSLNEMTRIGDRSDWLTVSTGASFTFGVTENGWLWGWGNNASGRTGQGISTGNTLVPTRIGTADNWVEARAAINSLTGIAINSSGELWAWGGNAQGQLGNGVDGNFITLPERVGTAANWVSVSGGSAHFLAFNAYGELFAWGNNVQGQLGLGDMVNRNEPTFVLQASDASTAARGGGHRSLMLFAMAPISDLHTLTKDLQKPEGTAAFTKSFTFTFERNSFDGNTADSNLLPIIPDRVLTLDDSNPAITTAGTTTITGTKDILEGITFDRAGVFSYLVSEVAGSSGTTLPSVMQYSAAVYEMNIYVRSSAQGGALTELYVYRITVTPRIVDNDTQTVGERNDELLFTNIYVPYEEPYIPGGNGSIETTPSVPTTPTVPEPDDNGSTETTPAVPEAGNGADRQPGKGPETGDHSSPVLHLMHMLLAAALITVLCYGVKRDSEIFVKKK